MTLRRPRAVLFDLDDTILNDSGNVDACWERACFAFPSQLGDIHPAALLSAVNRIREWYWADPVRHRLGRLDLDPARREIVAMALNELGVGDIGLASKIADNYSRDRDEGIHLFPDALETIRWCRSSGLALALLTNGNAAMQRAKVMRFALEECFDAILIEGELGFGKPDPRVYEQALRVLEVEAGDTWMIGDNLEWDVLQPQKMGMTGIWIDARRRGMPSALETSPRLIVRSLSELPGLIERAGRATLV
jgi:putative hydrolase of the HAD superfamily